MPRFNGTGPLTGRGMGPCAHHGSWGQGHGLRRGFGRFFHWGRTQAPIDNQTSLQDYKNELTEEMQTVDEELKKLNEKS